MPGAATMLARGWWRGMRAWWLATAATVGLVMVVLLSVSAVFAGLQDETEGRLADLFTDDVRVSRGGGGAVPPGLWRGDGLEEARRTLQEAGEGEVLGRLESQFVLSRRSLVEAYIHEDEQFEVRTPGSQPNGTDHYTLGVLVGLDLSPPSPGADRVRPYLHSGRLPRHDPDVVELLMGVDHFGSFLALEERSGMTRWPPDEPELRRFRFEVTAARVDPEGALKDIIRRPAEVVGLYATRLDAVDTFVLVADAPDVRILLGHDPAEPVANVLSVRTQQPGAVAAAARSQGWVAQGPDDFAQRYVGQLMRVVQALAVGLSAMFLALPVFLAWHAVAQVLHAHQREWGVCRAIGVGPGTIARAIFVVALGAVGIGLAGAAIVVAVADVVLDGPLAAWRGLPIPVRYSVDVRFAAAACAGVLGSVGLALWLALRRHLRADVPGLLRAP